MGEENINKNAIKEKYKEENLDKQMHVERYRCTRQFTKYFSNLKESIKEKKHFLLTTHNIAIIKYNPDKLRRVA